MMFCKLFRENVGKINRENGVIKGLGMQWEKNENEKNEKNGNFS